jgi:thiopeptide-type bacteriocin biosynthesis protein
MSAETRNQHIWQLFHSGFFTLRSPMLPIQEFTTWSGVLTAAAAWESKANQELLDFAWKRDVEILRDRLREILMRPEILHALYVASPSLQVGMEHWKRDPDSKKGLQAERALVRYFSRMTGRSTPFGLFSGYSVGEIKENAESTVLILQPRSEYRFFCRLDFDYLFALTTALRKDPALEMELHYWPNSSLHQIAGAWYYIECRIRDSQRTHHLVKVINDAYLDAVVAAAQNGATVSDLVKAVLNTPDGADVSEEEAHTYVLDLVRNNEILVTNLSPLLTGSSPLDDIIDLLKSIPSGAAATAALQRVRVRMSEIEGKGLAASPADYRAISLELENLPGKFDPSRLFQIDMVKPFHEAALSQEVIGEIDQGVDILCRLGQTSEPEELKIFRQAFAARYEQAMIPLLDALSEEAGVGFGTVAANQNDASPLLRGLVLRRENESVNWRISQLGVYETLVRQTVECLRSGKTELELDLSELRAESEVPVNLAEAFCVSGTLVAPSADSLRRGEFEFYLHGGNGPSGGRMLGRFCYADERIAIGVREHLRQEELHDPEAVYAEIVYLPEGRIGNVLSRPVLRAYEIPYLGRSGAPPDRQLPASDLLVGIKANNIVLYSRRLQRRVIPRVTNAHGFMNRHLPSLYRFLCYLQNQHGASVPGFSWGALEVLDRLPRVRVGRTIFALARWRLSAKEVELAGKQEGRERFVAVQELRRKHSLPRWVVLQEGDNHLTVDLENALSVDAFVHVLKRGVQPTLVEMYPPPDQMCATGPEGCFHHELNIPFVRNFAKKTPTIQAKRVLDSEHDVNRSVRIFPPGSEWLYIKLYGGPAAIDEILTTAIHPLVRNLTQFKTMSRWFFVRYSDPQQHVRIRFNGTPDVLSKEVTPLVLETFNPFLSSGVLWNIEVDTYQREVERYGGVKGVLAAEDIFFADSEAVLDILRELEGDQGLDTRWRIAIMGIDQLLADFGLDQQAKREAVSQWSEISLAKFKVDISGRRQLGDRFRIERRKLESLLDTREHSGELNFACQAFQRRSARIAETCDTLRHLSIEGRLAVNFIDLISSYVHMHVNRMIRSLQNNHEIVLYDFLSRLYEGSGARAAQLNR